MLEKASDRTRATSSVQVQALRAGPGVRQDARTSTATAKTQIKIPDGEEPIQNPETEPRGKKYAEYRMGE